MKPRSGTGAASATGGLPQPTNEESYLASGRPANLFRSAFADRQLERLYQASSLQQRRGGLECYLVTALLHSAYGFFAPETLFLGRCLLLLAFGLNICLLVWAEKGTKARDRLWGLLPHVAWLLALSQLLGQLLLKSTELTARDGLGWLLLLLYLDFATLPLRMSVCIAVAVASAGTYVAAVCNLARSDAPPEVLVINVSLSLAACLLGASTYSLSEFQQRRAFLETKQSLEVQLVIEEQSNEQERLLLSVLPRHVAVMMRQDLGSSFDTQFKKIYMSRHENVSILYADIVGFTAISSTYSAAELVKILNELFARFDQLSERYEQMRIKILGDCYYCISGAPQERPDHAVLCIYMGLSMVEAIKYVQQTTNSPVDMRVGIHTGAVLAGVLGQRQWQFDVYSKDVELANKMESSGRAGRVHISNVTLSFLSGEFEVEPAYGERREEALQKAGIQTFFIVRAIKPFKPAKTKSLASLNEESDYGGCHQRGTGSGSNPNNNDDDEEDKLDSDEFRERLRNELDNRGGGAELETSADWWTLHFKDPAVEKSFHGGTGAFSPLSLFGGPLVMICSSPIWKVQPFGRFTWGGIAVVTLFGVVLAFASCLGRSVRARWLRRILAILMIFSMSIFILLDAANCGIIEAHQVDPPTLAANDWFARCPYPSYYSYTGVLALIVISIPAYIGYVGKAMLMFTLAGLLSMLNLYYVSPSLDREDIAVLPGQAQVEFPLKYALSISLVTIALALVGVARYMEKARRVLYLRGREIEAQRERAADMKRRNGALIYNILPPHVATYFLSSSRHHDDLYSQSYAEVGVLFASMPNFADFYTEESINNQGLECLRFLNEVISDFDAILDQDRFKDIIKIKTIGSTYMAASGITETGCTEEEPKWSHLARLVEFAVEMKKTLSVINEQSFNHFVLKMGINHGPVIAGVIGARKPHYDIWGNTVNVASRMDSTGKVGFLQVTDETRKILEPFGYGFEQRGLVFVKGKGQLLTHYLISKNGEYLNLDSDIPEQPKHTIIYQ